MDDSLNPRNRHATGVVTVLDSTYDARLPARYADVLDSLFGWASLDYASLFVPVACATSGHGFQSLLLLTALSPLVLICGGVVVGKFYKASMLGMNAWRDGFFNALPLALVISFTFVPSVSTRLGLP